MEIQLREYQKECIENIEKSFFKENYESVLASLPTGAGKTIIFSSFAHKNKLRTLVIAHRDELLHQAIEKFRFVAGKKVDTGFIKRNQWEEKPFTSASIQTLYRNLDKIDGKKFDLVVVDEAHHTSADSYLQVLEKIKKTNPSIKVLGVTATPFRSDDKNLADFYQHLAYSIDIKDLMSMGYLVPIKGKRVYLDVDLSRASIREGDFTDKSLEKLFNDDLILEQIVEKWIDEGEERKTIFFVPTVAYAKMLKDKFLSKGIPCEEINAKLSISKRQEIIEKFRNGEIKVLTNVNVLTEGFDDPSVNCIGIVRPTKSLNLYTQIVGRGLRLSPETGKKDCLILDYTGISKEHSIVGLSELFGVPIPEEELEKGVAIGSVEDKETGERKLKVLVGGGTEEFKVEGIDAYEYITNIKMDGKEYSILTCGKNRKAIVLVRAGKSNALYLIDKNRKQLLKANIPEDYAGSIFIHFWTKYKDNFMDEYKDRAVNEEPTKKQLKMLENASKYIKFKIPEIALSSKIHATNLISLIMSKYNYKVFCDYVFDFDGTYLIDVRTGKKFPYRQLNELKKSHIIGYVNYQTKQFVEG